MIAARGKAQNDSIHASYISSEYLCLPDKMSAGMNSTGTFNLKRKVIS